MTLQRLEKLEGIPAFAAMTLQRLEKLGGIPAFAGMTLQRLEKLEGIPAFAGIIMLMRFQSTLVRYISTRMIKLIVIIPVLTDKSLNTVKSGFANTQK